jgi:hypothetical protein
VIAIENRIDIPFSIAICSPLGGLSIRVHGAPSELDLSTFRAFGIMQPGSIAVGQLYLVVGFLKLSIFRSNFRNDRCCCENTRSDHNILLLLDECLGW